MRTAEFKNMNRGQFLIESMVAIGIVTMGLLGMLTLLSNSISLNRVVADQYTGTYLAGEGIEVVKSIVDENIIRMRPWNTGLANGSFEVQYNSTALGANGNRILRFNNGIYSYDPLGAPTTFIRTLTVQLVSANEIRVNSRVRWTTRGAGSFNVDLEDHFYNWR